MTTYYTRIKYSFALTALIVSTLTVSQAFASEVTGTIQTGLSTGNVVNGFVIASPTATPLAGTYTGGQTVTLSAPGSSSIHYFLNTTDLNPALTCSAGTVYNSSTGVAMDGSGLLRTIACYGGTHASPLVSFTYVINTVSVPAGGGGGGGGGGGAYSAPTTSSTVTDDFNSDSTIDIFDFNILMSNWGTASGATTATGDTNGDGRVDIFDFNSLIANWNI